MKKYLFLLSAFMIVASCTTGYHYNFSLLSLDRPVAATGKYGPVKVEKIPDSLVARYWFSDSLVDGTFSINTEQFEFVCRNKADRSIRIDWEKAAYINPYGVRQRVIHGGVLYERKSDLQAPSIIRKGATLSDHALPADNVRVYEYGYGGTTVYPLFSTREFGRTASVLLPLEVDGVVNEYWFHFKISMVQ
jgi:hypothetical protein